MANTSKSNSLFINIMAYGSFGAMGALSTSILVLLVYTIFQTGKFLFQ